MGQQSISAMEYSFQKRTIKREELLDTFEQTIHNLRQRESGDSGQGCRTAVAGIGGSAPILGKMI